MVKPKLKEIAVALGVSPGRVTRYVELGMPVYSIEAATEWKAQNIRPRVVLLNPKTDEEAKKAARLQPPAGDGSPPHDWSWRNRLEAAQAKTAELQLQKLAGELVSLADIERIFGARLSGMKVQLDALPARAAAALGIDDAHRRTVLQYLRDELAQIMTGVAEPKAAREA